MVYETFFYEPMRESLGRSRDKKAPTHYEKELMRCQTRGSRDKMAPSHSRWHIETRKPSSNRSGTNPPQIITIFQLFLFLDSRVLTWLAEKRAESINIKVWHCRQWASSSHMFGISITLACRLVTRAHLTQPA